jgi:D-serine deaminase-like pyridoxal phosphate-dependent protein
MSVAQYGNSLSSGGAEADPLGPIAVFAAANHRPFCRDKVGRLTIGANVPGQACLLSYDEFRRALQGQRLPTALINLDAFDHNVRTLFHYVIGTGKKIRLATKSLRCPWIYDYLVALDKSGVLAGFMSFSPEEAEFLTTLGHDRILVAYPTVQPGDLAIMTRLAGAGKNVCYVVDSREHLDIMGAAGRQAGVTLPAALELDMALSWLGRSIYFGVRRSPLHDVRALVDLIRYAEKIGGVRVVGVMTYEAQLAGLNDRGPYSRLANPAKRWVKKHSIPIVAKLRAELARELRYAGIRLDFINGGGSGSIHLTSRDPVVSEVTIGSGLYCSHLFRYYDDLELFPAAFFATQIVRQPAPGMITCLGGGYLASGSPGPDRLPQPYAPACLKLLPLEGAGEVQTPLRLPRNAPHLKLGDPIIWQHAKAGELLERFNQVSLIRDGVITGQVPTYRGLGQSFL